MSEPTRTRWTDDRIDDLVVELREMRAEMREGFHELREEMRAMRTELKDDIGEARQDLRGFRHESGEDARSLRTELYSTHRWTVNLWATTVLGFVALFIQVSLR
jgi:uncharacterized coiled-coil DUF342 family protein